MRILVTDGDQRSALAVTRSLGRLGMQVVVGDVRVPCLASSSRYCDKEVVYPSPFRDEQQFVSSIRDIIQREKIDMVMPISDVTSAIVAEQKPDLERYARMAVCDATTFWRASDKNALHRLASEIGVPTPTTHYVEDAKVGLDSLGELSFPCVIKPSRSRLRANGRWVRTSVMRAQSRKDLEALFRTRSELNSPFMIQREIKGDGFGVFTLCDRGTVKAWFAHRRIREKPPWGGVSVLRESVPVDPLAREYAGRLLSRLEWHGVAMVEFKEDRSTGIPYLMEINGRVWGSLQLAIDAGINFPMLQVELYCGHAVPPQLEYRTGIRSRWFLGDLDHLLARLANQQTTGDLPPLWSTVWDFFRFYQRNMYYEVESFADPKPALYETMAYVRNIVRGLGKRIHRRKIERSA